MFKCVQDNISVCIKCHHKIKKLGDATKGFGRSFFISLSLQRFWPPPWIKLFSISCTSEARFLHGTKFRVLNMKETQTPIPWQAAKSKIEDYTTSKWKHKWKSAPQYVADNNRSRFPISRSTRVLWPFIDEYDRRVSSRVISDNS